MSLSCHENLLEGARVWYYFISGCIGAKLSLQQKTLNCFATLGFCSWYSIANIVSGYNVSITCIRKIKAKYYSKRGSKSTRMKRMHDFIAAESAASGAEAYDVPREEEETETTHPEVGEEETEDPYSYEEYGCQANPVPVF